MENDLRRKLLFAFFLLNCNFVVGGFWGDSRVGNWLVNSGNLDYGHRDYVQVFWVCGKVGHVVVDLLNLFARFYHFDGRLLHPLTQD
jgi:hypothetical protein